MAWDCWLMGECLAKQIPIQSLCKKLFYWALCSLALSPSVFGTSMPEREWKAVERSKRVVTEKKNTGLRAFCTQKAELESKGGRLNAQRDWGWGVGCTREKAEKAGTSLQSCSGQRLPGAQEFMVDLRSVCNKKELKGRRGWTRLKGRQQSADASIGESSL